MTTSLIYGRDRLHLVTAAYGDGAMAVQIVTEDGEPFATLSTRLADDPLPDGVFRLKDWSENARIAAAVIGAGLVTRIESIPPRATGWVVADAFRLAGDDESFGQIIAAQRDERPAIEVYGTPEHEAWLLDMERRGEL